MLYKWLFLGSLTALLAGCFSGPASFMSKQHTSKQYAPLVTAYDYQIISADHQPLSLPRLADQLQKADVIFVGEYHRNQASHLLEMQLFAARHKANAQAQRDTLLSMEMFSRDQQLILQRYLSGEIGEKYLIEEAPTWGNYQSSYRPLVEYAKQHNLPVIAANATSDIVRCIGRTGEDYIATLNDLERAHIASAPFAEIPGYEDKFFGYMKNAGHTPDERARNSYLAQATRDNTMAESIARSLQQRPGSQIFHLNGSFHSEDGLGTVAALQRLMPELNIRVITPIHIDAFDRDNFKGRDDFYYLLKPQPREFVDEDYMKQSRRAMFEKSRKKARACTPLKITL